MKYGAHVLIRKPENGRESWPKDYDEHNNTIQIIASIVPAREDEEDFYEIGMESGEVFFSDEIIIIPNPDMDC